MSSVIDRQAVPKPDMTVYTTRVVPISMDQAWDAWTTADGVQSWWRMHSPDASCAIDARVGAEYRIHCASSGLGARGTILTIDRSSRLMLQWRWVGDLGPAGDGLVQVHFAVDEEDVAITVEHSLSDDAALEVCARRWNLVMDSFAGLRPDGQALVCPRCGWSITGEPPVCTGTGCPLSSRERWRANIHPVPLIDY